jgi:hypothetical protein
MGWLLHISPLPHVAIIALACSALCVEGQTAHSPIQPAQNFLWAKLESRLDSASGQAGDVVTARVNFDWSSGRCVVPSGTLVQGHIAAIQLWTASSKSTSVSLRFTVPCEGGIAVPVVLIAVLYPIDDGDRGQMDTYMSMPAGIGPGASGRQSTDPSLLPTAGDASSLQQPPKVRIGQVTGVRHVSLAAATGPREDAVLSTGDRRLRLQAHTRLAFLAMLPDQ